MAKKSKGFFNIFSRVNKDKKKHAIISKQDQEQLTNIILTLKGENQLDQEQQARIQEKYSKKSADSIIAKSEDRSIPKIANDAEIEKTLDQLVEFNLDEMQEKQHIYEIYMAKLQDYKSHPKFTEIISQAKYGKILVAHLNFLSKSFMDSQNVNLQQGYNRA